MANGASRARALAVCAAGALATFLGSADAQTRTAAQAERDRRSETARAEQLRAEAAATRREVQALNAQLGAAANRRRQAEALAAAAETRLYALEAEIGAEGARRARTRNALEAALIVAAFASRRPEPGAARDGVFARAAAVELANAERGSRRVLVANRTLMHEIAAEGTAAAQAQAAIDAEREAAAAMLAQRRATEARLALDIGAAERRARTLASEARTLRELAARTERAPQRGAGGASVVPTSWLAPAQGRLARPFGAASGGGPAAQGVVLQTQSRAQVVAPAAGEAAYAGLFRSYGNVLIINVNDGYAIVFTGLETINVGVGEAVRPGQLVGEMPNSDTAAPELYVEVRRGGQPVDPERWLSARGITAENRVRAG